MKRGCFTGSFSESLEEFNSADMVDEKICFDKKCINERNVFLDLDAIDQHFKTFRPRGGVDQYSKLGYHQNHQAEAT